MRKKWSLLCILMGMVLLFFGGKQYVEPNLDEISQLKAKGVVTEIVGKAVRTVFSDSSKPEDYFVMKRDENGRIQLIQANTIVMNQKIAASMVPHRSDLFDGTRIMTHLHQRAILPFRSSLLPPSHL